MTASDFCAYLFTFFLSASLPDVWLDSSREMYGIITLSRSASLFLCCDGRSLIITDRASSGIGFESVLSLP